jgi:phytoene synthase
MANKVGAQIKEGSDLYYAALYLNKEIRNQACLIEMLRREVSHIPESCSEPDIARAKLAWWIEEFKRTKECLSRHPLTKALTLNELSRAHLMDVLIALTAGTFEDVTAKSFFDRSAVTKHLRHLNSDLVSLMAQLFEIYSGDDIDLILNLACAIERSNAILGLRDHRNSPTLYFCEPDMGACGLTPQSIRSSRSSSELERFLEGQITIVKSDLISTLSQLSRNLRKRGKFFTTQAEINLQVLDLALKKNCRILENRMELLPIRKLWLAWKVKNWG